MKTRSISRRMPGWISLKCRPTPKRLCARCWTTVKYKYQAQKKANEAKKKQKVIEVKEIKLRPGIDTHDYDVKMRAMKRFFDDGDKVKVTMRFRGREMAHTELGFDLLQKVKSDTDEFAKVEYEPKMEGRQMIMILSPR